MTQVEDTEYQRDQMLSHLCRLHEQMGLLVFGQPGYAPDVSGGGTALPDSASASGSQFELNAVILDIQMCDLTDRLLRDEDWVAKYPELAAHLRAGQRERKKTIKQYLLRHGIIASFAARSA